MFYFLKCLNAILKFFDFNIFTFANIFPFINLQKSETNSV